MILRADRKFTLETPEGIQTINAGDFFRTESRKVLQGYAHKLSRAETREVLDEYVEEADRIFNRECRSTKNKRRFL